MSNPTGPASSAPTGGATQPRAARGDYWSATIREYDDLISKPKLTRQYLERPHVKFILFLFQVVLKETGFGAGLIPDEILAMASSRDKLSRDQKLFFLDRMINFVGLCTRKPLPVLGLTIAQGKQPEKTNLLLQLFARHAKNRERLPWQKAVRFICSGRNPDMTGREIQRRKELALRRAAAAEAEAETGASAPGGATQPQPGSGPDEAAARARAQAQADTQARAQAQAEAQRRAQAQAEAQRRAQADAQRQADTEAQARAQQQEERQLQLQRQREEQQRRQMQAERQRREQQQRAAAEQAARDAELARQERESAQAEAEALARAQMDQDRGSSRRTSGRSSASVMSSGRSTESSSVDSSGRSHGQGPSARNRYEDGGSRDDVGYTDIEMGRRMHEGPGGHLEADLPLPGRALMGDDGLDSMEQVGEDDEYYVVEREPTVSMKQRRARARAARDDEPGMGLTAKLIQQDEATAVAVAAGKKAARGRRGPEDGAPRRKKIVLGGSAGKRDERRDGEGRIMDLWKNIQTVCQSTNPIGKAMDYIHEDLDSMNSELAHWKKQSQLEEGRLKEERRKTEQKLRVFRNQIAEIEQAIESTKEKILHYKAEVLQNELKTESLLRNVIS